MSLIPGELTKIHFFPKPRRLKWARADGEVVLFELKARLSPTKQILVDTSIAAEFANELTSAYNIYRLYINNKQVTQTGVQVADAQFSTNLEQASITWGGKIESSCDCNFLNVRIRITAQLVGNSTIAANVNNNIGNFKGAKSAAMRLVIV